MGPIEVGENNRGKVERDECENAYHWEEEKKVAMGNHHSEPVGASKLVDQHTRGSNERRAEDQETNSHEDACTGHWLSPVCSHVHSAIVAQILPELRQSDSAKCCRLPQVYSEVLSTRGA